MQCLCHRVSNDWLVEILENKFFSEQSPKFSSASFMQSSFGLISDTFVFGRLLAVFSLSLKYGTSELKKSYFLSSVSAYFASRLPESDLVAFLYFALFLLNLFFKLSNRLLASPRLREQMCALL